ncbi:MAG TPA: hypothetical protein VJ161_01650 [Geobacteraceae bacterium]|nr:hypothetical protein [Geobacteraceae bacterium]
MDSSIPRASKFILQVVENQLNDNQPAEARQALERLIAAGFSEEDSKHLIGSAIAVEMRNVVQTSKPFNAERYVELLGKLPELPTERS